MKRNFKQIAGDVLGYMVSGLVILVFGAYMITNALDYMTSADIKESALSDEDYSKSIVQDLWKDVNAERNQANISSLALEENLNTAAASKCKALSETDSFEHELSDGRKPESFLTSGTYTYMGENLAADYLSASEVVEAWMHSPEHKENIVNPLYKKVGFATCNSPSHKNMVVQFLTD